MSTIELILLGLCAFLAMYSYGACKERQNTGESTGGIKLVEFLDHGTKEKEFVISCHACKTITLIHKALVFPAILSREWVTHCPKCEQNRLVAHLVESDKGKALIALIKKQ